MTPNTGARTYRTVNINGNYSVDGIAMAETSEASDALWYYENFFLKPRLSLSMNKRTVMLEEQDTYNG